MVIRQPLAEASRQLDSRKALGQPGHARRGGQQIVLRGEGHFQSQLQRLKVALGGLGRLPLGGINIAFGLEQVGQRDELACVESFAKTGQVHQLRRRQGSHQAQIEAREALQGAVYFRQRLGVLLKPGEAQNFANGGGHLLN